MLPKEYDLVVVPVIDKYLRLIGRITIDDLVDVIYEEHQEDIAQIRWDFERRSVGRVAD